MNRSNTGAALLVERSKGNGSSPRGEDHKLRRRKVRNNAFSKGQEQKSWTKVEAGMLDLIGLGCLFMACEDVTVSTTAVETRCAVVVRRSLSVAVSRWRWEETMRRKTKAELS